MTEHDKLTARALGMVMGRSLSNPLHLTIAAGSAGASLVWGWPLAALGGATFAALVAWDLVSPEFWKKTMLEAAPKPAADWPLETLRDASLRELCADVRRARGELAEVARSHPDAARLLASVLASVDLLHGRMRGVAERADQLADYLRRTDVASIQAELEQLALRVERAQKEETRAQYLQTIDARKEQLGAVRDIAAALERAHAQLLRLRATFEGLAARVVRLSALGTSALDEATSGMNAELDEVYNDLEAFEEVLCGLEPQGAKP
jgi:hypothetical protein